MVAKLIINDKTFDIEILDPKLQEIIVPKKTGYEIAKLGEVYYHLDSYNTIIPIKKEAIREDDIYRAVANYYSSREIAENNARADKLMRQLRRFAVENREHELNWNDDDQAKYIITYRHETKKFFPEDVYDMQDFGAIYFDSAETTCKAIDTFKDELIWYFTEYKDSLR